MGVNSEERLMEVVGEAGRHKDGSSVNAIICSGIGQRLEFGRLRKARSASAASIRIL